MSKGDNPIELLFKGVIIIAAKIKEIKKKLSGILTTETDLENTMYDYGFLLMDEDDDSDRILKYTNFTSQIWIDVLRDESNIMIDNIRHVTKEKDVETKKEPFRSFEDLMKVQNYFLETKQIQYWLLGWLMCSLGRRVGDTVSLKWSDVYTPNGKYRERLCNLKEEKTGKKLGVALHEFPRNRIEEYCKALSIEPIEYYEEKIFSKGAAAFRTALDKAVNVVGIDYPIGTHSYRKYFGNLIYKLHPNDADAIKMIQYILGHSSEEITKLYIAAIDEKKDAFVKDLSVYLEKSYNGDGYVVDHSPVISFRTQDMRKAVADIYNAAKNSNGEEDIVVINNLISMMENLRIK